MSDSTHSADPAVSDTSADQVMPVTSHSPSPSRESAVPDTSADPVTPIPSQGSDPHVSNPKPTSQQASTAMLASNHSTIPDNPVIAVSVQSTSLDPEEPNNSADPVTPVTT